MKVYLNKRIFAESRTAERRSSTEKTRVRNFLDGLSNAKHKSCIDEGHNDVRIIFLCNRNHKSRLD